MQTISRSQARELDRRAIEEFGMSGVMLMENAGRGTADILCQIVDREVSLRKPVAVVCGAGNNGGDGFVIARHLDLRGFAVRVYLAVDPVKLRGDAAVNFQIARRAALVMVPLFERTASAELSDFQDDLRTSCWIIDALLGTGATGEPRPPFAAIIEAMNASGTPILAVDVPSGLDCDTGHAPPHTVRARDTVTFVAAKPGLVLPAAKPYVGTLHVADIGAPRVLVASVLETTSPAR